MKLQSTTIKIFISSTFILTSLESRAQALPRPSGVTVTAARDVKRYLAKVPLTVSMLKDAYARSAASLNSPWGTTGLYKFINHSQSSGTHRF